MIKQRLITKIPIAMIALLSIGSGVKAGCPTIKMKLSACNHAPYNSDWNIAFRLGADGKIACPLEIIAIAYSCSGDVPCAEWTPTYPSNLGIPWRGSVITDGNYWELCTDASTCSEAPRISLSDALSSLGPLSMPSVDDLTCSSEAPPFVATSPSDCDCSANVGNPLNVITGEKIESVIDYAMPVASMPFAIGRRYGSMRLASMKYAPSNSVIVTHKRMLDPGWDFSFEARLEKQATIIDGKIWNRFVAVLPPGPWPGSRSRIEFPLYADGSPDSEDTRIFNPPDVDVELLRGVHAPLGVPSFTTQFPVAFTVRFKNDSVIYFDARGVFLGTEDLRGNGYRFNYDSNEDGQYTAGDDPISDTCTINVRHTTGLSLTIYKALVVDGTYSEKHYHAVVDDVEYAGNQDPDPETGPDIVELDYSFEQYLSTDKRGRDLLKEVEVTIQSAVGANQSKHVATAYDYEPPVTVISFGKPLLVGKKEWDRSGPSDVLVYDAKFHYEDLGPSGDPRRCIGSEILNDNGQPVSEVWAVEYPSATERIVTKKLDESNNLRYVYTVDPDKFQVKEQYFPDKTNYKYKQVSEFDPVTNRKTLSTLTGTSEFAPSGAPPTYYYHTKTSYRTDHPNLIDSVESTRSTSATFSTNPDNAKVSFDYYTDTGHEELLKSVTYPDGTQLYLNYFPETGGSDDYKKQLIQSVETRNTSGNPARPLDKIIFGYDEQGPDQTPSVVKGVLSWIQRPAPADRKVKISYNHYGNPESLSFDGNGIARIDFAYNEYGFIDEVRKRNPAATSGADVDVQTDTKTDALGRVYEVLYPQVSVGANTQQYKYVQDFLGKHLLKSVQGIDGRQVTFSYNDAMQPTDVVSMDHADSATGANAVKESASINAGGALQELKGPEKPEGRSYLRNSYQTSCGCLRAYQELDESGNHYLYDPNGSPRRIARRVAWEAPLSNNSVNEASVEGKQFDSFVYLDYDDWGHSQSIKAEAGRGTDLPGRPDVDVYFSWNKQPLGVGGEPVYPGDSGYVPSSFLRSVAQVTGNVSGAMPGSDFANDFRFYYDEYARLTRLTSREVLSRAGGLKSLDADTLIEYQTTPDTGYLKNFKFQVGDLGLGRYDFAGDGVSPQVDDMGRIRYFQYKASSGIAGATLIQNLPDIRLDMEYDPNLVDLSGRVRAVAVKVGNVAAMKVHTDVDSLGRLTALTYLKPNGDALARFEYTYGINVNGKHKDHGVGQALGDHEGEHEYEYPSLIQEMREYRAVGSASLPGIAATATIPSLPIQNGSTVEFAKARTRAFRYDELGRLNREYREKGDQTSTNYYFKSDIANNLTWSRDPALSPSEQEFTTSPGTHNQLVSSGPRPSGQVKDVYIPVTGLFDVASDSEVKKEDIKITITRPDPNGQDPIVVNGIEEVTPEEFRIDAAPGFPERRAGAFRKNCLVGQPQSDQDYYVKATLTDSRGETATVLDYMVRFDANARRVYAYDKRLNLVQLTELPLSYGPEQVTRYDYDAQDRLIRVALPNGTGREFTYDAMSRRTSTTRVAGDGTRETEYHIYGQDWETLADVTVEIVTGQVVVTPKRIYVAPGGMDSQVAMLVRQTDNTWKTYLYIRDHLGSVVALYDASQGQIVESYEYESYGLPTVYGQSGQQLSDSAVGNRMMFTGREWDAGTEFYHYRLRTYSPIERRFMQGDPIGLDGGWNYYAYCGGDPINSKDPLGLKTVVVVGWKPREQNAWREYWQDIVTRSKTKPELASKLDEFSVWFVDPKDPVGSFVTAVNSGECGDTLSIITHGWDESIKLFTSDMKGGDVSLRPGDKDAGWYKSIRRRQMENRGARYSEVLIYACGTPGKPALDWGELFPYSVTYSADRFCAVSKGALLFPENQKQLLEKFPARMVEEVQPAQSMESSDQCPWYFY